MWNDIELLMLHDNSRGQILLSTKRELIIIYEAVITGEIRLDWGERFVFFLLKIILKFKENDVVSDLPD